MTTQIIETFANVDSDDLTYETNGVHDNAEEIEKTTEEIEQQALIERVLQGDTEAFGAIVDHYHTLMMRTALLIVGDRDIAADAVQEAA